MLEKIIVEGGTLVFLALIITEMLGRVLAFTKDRIALIVGPACALVAYGAGIIGPYGDGLWGWAAALLFGGLGAVAAGVVNDYGVKPFQRKED